MPKDSQIISVQTQHGQPCLWALVDPASSLEERTFYIYGTGHDIREVEPNIKYLGTFQLVDGAFVGHLFEYRCLDTRKEYSNENI